VDYLAAFEISASGMMVEKTRLDTVALNLANSKSTKTVNGTPFKPLKVLSGPKVNSFDLYMNQFSQTNVPAGVQVLDIKEMEVAPKLVYEPGHPDANADGFVAYPNINPVSEMLTMIEATRSYEANVKAFNAAKSMALQALEIGRK